MSAVPEKSRPAKSAASQPLSGAVGPAGAMSDVDRDDVARDLAVPVPVNGPVA